MVKKISIFNNQSDLTYLPQSNHNKRCFPSRQLTNTGVSAVRYHKGIRCRPYPMRILSKNDVFRGIGQMANWLRLASSSKDIILWRNMSQAGCCTWITNFFTFFHSWIGTYYLFYMIWILIFNTNFFLRWCIFYEM